MIYTTTNNLYAVLARNENFFWAIGEEGFFEYSYGMSLLFAYLRTLGDLSREIEFIAFCLFPSS